MKTARDYQEPALVYLFNHLFTTKKHALIDAPVAAGKSFLIAETIRRLHALYPHLRILSLVHSKRLIEQNVIELFSQYPNVDAGIYCAGLKQKRLHNDVTFASIQSIAGKASFMPRPPEIIIIDEVHLVSHKSSTQYREFIADCLVLNPNLRLIGFTGTVFRSDTGRLDEGENRLFDEVTYTIPMTYMIEEGWWAKPVSPKVAFEMDTSNIPMRNGDFVSSAIERNVNTPEINKLCINDLVDLGRNRNRWLVFAAGKQHAEDVCNELRAHGIAAEFITDDTPANEEDSILENHKAGKFKALVNVAKLTTGYNDPYIDLICIMRPMRSPALYIQCVGRGVRPIYADNYDASTREARLRAIADSIKPNCMIVDYGGVVKALGPIDKIEIHKKYMGEVESDGEGEAATKECPQCGSICAASQRYCYNCSYCFIVLDDSAGNAAVVSVDIEPEWVDVLDVGYDRHEKKGGLPSMKVTYYTLTNLVREWVCFEHHTFDVGDNKRFAWSQAVKWHKKRLPDIDVPKSVDEALIAEYPQPKRILIKPKGKYFDILDYDFSDKEESVSEIIDNNEYFDIPF